MIATYHNHTSWSDGKATVAETVAAAKVQGIDELGFSDHLTLTPSGEDPSWSMPSRRVGEYAAEVLSHRDTPGLAVRLGVEADWIEGQDARLAGVLASLPLDYAIGAVHYVFGKEIDGHPRRWDVLPVEEQDETHREYWRQTTKMAASGLFDIIAHMDLTKKFGHTPTCDVTDLVNEALDAIRDCGAVVELNTAGWHKPCNDAYPTLDILKGCHARDIPVTLSSDSHQTDHLTRDFDRGAERLRAAGYTQIARFAERQMRFEPL